MNWKPNPDKRDEWLTKDGGLCLRIRRVGMGADTGYCMYSGRRYLGTVRTLEEAKQKTEKGKRTWKT